MGSRTKLESAIDRGVEVYIFKRKVVEATLELCSEKQGEAAQVTVPSRTLASTFERGVNETLLSRCFRLLGSLSSFGIISV